MSILTSYFGDNPCWIHRGECSGCVTPSPLRLHSLLAGSHWCLSVAPVYRRLNRLAVDDSPTSLGKLFHLSTTLELKKFLLYMWCVLFGTKLNLAALLLVGRLLSALSNHHVYSYHNFISQHHVDLVSPLL